MKTDIEINANGYVWSQSNYDDGFNPFNILLDAVSAQQAKITLGSDAHAPQLVAKFFPELINLLKSKGITTVSIFDRKKRTSVSLG